MLPVLCKPRLISIKNRWFQKHAESKYLNKELGLVFLSVLIILSVYSGTYSILDTLKKSGSLPYLPPALTLSFFLLAILFMLVFSNGVSALTSFFLAKDLDLVLSSPLKTFSFFLGKTADVLLTSTWIIVVFTIPILVAFGQAYQTPLTYYPLSFFILLPFLLIPSALAILIVTVFAFLMPLRRTREVLLAVAVLAMAIILMLLHAASAPVTTLNKAEEIHRISSLFSLTFHTWFPSYWSATCLGELLERRGTNYLPHLTLLYSTAMALAAAAFLIIKKCYKTAYSNAKNRANLQLKSRQSQKLLTLLLPFASPPCRAIVGKEYKTFARDITQAIQLLLLIGLCMIYLYNFRFSRVIDSVPEGHQIWWKHILSIANIIMGAFVTTAVSARFVFPSVSLEGRSFWIYLSSPLPMRKILFIKFCLWYFPIAAISSVVFASGALALQLSPGAVLVTIVISWILSYGIIGLGLGLGALFSRFDWEHSSQLSTSLGSLLYMIACAVLIFVCIIPSSILIFVYTIRGFGLGPSNLQWYIFLYGTLLLLYYLNRMTFHWALKAGENHLSENMGG